MNLIVIAAAGIRVPRETEPQRHITDDHTVVVVDSAYYRRRIADGDLLQVEAVIPRRRIKHRNA